MRIQGPIISEEGPIYLKSAQKFLFSPLSDEDLISACENIQIHADGKLKSTGYLVTKGHLLMTAGQKFSQTGQLDAQKGIQCLSEKEDCIIKGDLKSDTSITLQSPTQIVVEGGARSLRDMLISAGNAVSVSGKIAAQNTCSFTSKLIHIHTSDIDSGSLVLKGSEKVIFQKDFKPAHNVQIETPCVSLKKAFEVGGDVSLKIARLKIKERGGFKVNKNCALDYGGEIVIPKEWTLFVNGDFTLKAQALKNYGRIVVEKNLDCHLLGDFLNENLVGAGGTFTIETSHPLLNDHGFLLSKGTMTLTVGLLKNLAGRIESDDSLILNAARLENTRPPLHRYYNPNRGEKWKWEQWDIRQANDRPSFLLAKQNIKIEVSSGVNEGSTIFAGNLLEETKGSVDNITRFLRYECCVNSSKTWGWDRRTKDQDVAFKAGKQLTLKTQGDVRNSGLVESTAFILHAHDFYNGIFDNWETGQDKLLSPQIALAAHLSPLGNEGLFFYDRDRRLPYVINSFFSLGHYSISLDESSVSFEDILKVSGDQSLLDTYRLWADPYAIKTSLEKALMVQGGRSHLSFDFAPTMDETVSRLMKNALLYRRQNPTAKFGEALSQEHYNKVTEPMVWLDMGLISDPEKKQEEKAITTTLILPESFRQALRSRAGGEVKSNDATFMLEGNLYNTGYLKIRHRLLAVCDSFYNIRRTIAREKVHRSKGGICGGGTTYKFTVHEAQPGGDIQTEETEIYARQEILNKGGSMISRGDTALEAKNNITNEAQIDQSVVTWGLGGWDKLKGGVKNFDIRTDFIPGTIKSQKGAITLIAGDYAKVIGSLLEAKNDIILTAQKYIQQTAQSSSHTTSSKSSFRGFTIQSKTQKEIIIQPAHVVSKEGNVTFIAHEGNIDLKGAKIYAALKVTLDAQGGCIQVSPYIHQEEETYKVSGVQGFGVASEETRQSTTSVVTSPIMAQEIEMKAALDVEIRGSLLTALQDIRLTAGRDVLLHPEQIEHYIESKKFSATLDFFGSKALNAVMARDCYQAAQSLLREFSFPASMEDLAYSEDVSDTLVSTKKVTYQTYQTLKQIQETGSFFSGLTQGKFDEVVKGNITPSSIFKLLDPKIRLGRSIQNAYWTEVLQTWIKARRILINAGRDLQAKGVTADCEIIEIDSGRDIIIENAEETQTVSSQDTGLSVDATLTLGADFSQHSSRSTRALPSTFKISDRASLKAGCTLRLKGATLSAARIYIDAKKLELESVQDSQDGTSRQGQVGIGLSSVQIGQEEKHSRWVHAQTRLEALDEFIAHVSEETRIKGAVIDAIRGVLYTPTLIHEDLEDDQERQCLSFGLTDLKGFSDPSNIFVGLVDFDHLKEQKRQKNRATIGQGIQIITESDLNHLNRDVDHSREITRRDRIHVHVVAPLVRDFGQIQEDLKTFRWRLAQDHSHAAHAIQPQVEELQDFHKAVQKLSLPEAEQEALFTQGSEALAYVNLLKSLDKDHGSAQLLYISFHPQHIDLHAHTVPLPRKTPRLSSDKELPQKAPSSRTSGLNHSRASDQPPSSSPSSRDYLQALLWSKIGLTQACDRFRSHGEASLQTLSSRQAAFCQTKILKRVSEKVEEALSCVSLRQVPEKSLPESNPIQSFWIQDTLARLPHLQGVNPSPQEGAKTTYGIPQSQLTSQEKKARQEWQGHMAALEDVGEDLTEPGRRQTVGTLLGDQVQRQHHLDTRGRTRAIGGEYSRRRSPSPERSDTPLERGVRVTQAYVGNFIPEPVKEVSQTVGQVLGKAVEVTGLGPVLEAVDLGAHVRRSARTLGVPQATAQDMGTLTNIASGVSGAGSIAKAGASLATKAAAKTVGKKTTSTNPASLSSVPAQKSTVTKYPPTATNNTRKITNARVKDETKGGKETRKKKIQKAGAELKKIHKNSLHYEGPTHVYKIENKSGLYKIGESARGTNKFGQSKRAESQARKLRKETGEPHKTKVLAVLQGKKQARQVETALIESIKKTEGSQALPGNKGRH